LPERNEKHNINHFITKPDSAKQYIFTFRPWSRISDLK